MTVAVHHVLPVRPPSVGVLAPASTSPSVVLSPSPRGPDLGKVAQSPAVTSVWRIAADTGGVSLMSGEAVRLTTGPANPPLITLECPVAACAGKEITAEFAADGGGRATILGFTPGVVTSHGLRLVNVAGAGTAHMVMTFIGTTSPASAAFTLGMTVRLSPGRGGTSPTYGYALAVRVR